MESLLDNDFSKPQSFHDKAISRSGGIDVLFHYFFLVSIFYYTRKILFEYIFIGLSLFLIGYLDDIKIKISPNLRLILMIVFIVLFIKYFSIKIDNM